MLLESGLYSLTLGAFVFWHEVEKHVVLRATLWTSMHEVEAILIALFDSPLRSRSGFVPTYLTSFGMILEVSLHEVDERLRPMTMCPHRSLATASPRISLVAAVRPLASILSYWSTG